MNYKKCYLYGLQSKKRLMELLHIDRKVYCKGSFINRKISPYISVKNDKPRLIEVPDQDILNIQGIVFRALCNIDFPTYVFSGIRGRSYIGNAKKHEGSTCLFKVDISKFFPNISRDKVYNFYLNKLNTSPDVANILTNFSTINLDMKNQDTVNLNKVNKFIEQNNILQRNHLITGSPLSQIMSYLANVDMFESMFKISKNNGVNMTVYVDDIVFSAQTKISVNFRNRIIEILSKHGYQVSPRKCRYYNVPYNKKVTGVILDRNGLLNPANSLLNKTRKYIQEINEGDFSHIANLKGCLVVIKTINGSFNGIYQRIKNIKVAEPI